MRHLGSRTVNDRITSRVPKAVIKAKSARHQQCGNSRMTRPGRSNHDDRATIAGYPGEDRGIVRSQPSAGECGDWPGRGGPRNRSMRKTLAVKHRSAWSKLVRVRPPLEAAEVIVDGDPSFRGSW